MKMVIGIVVLALAVGVGIYFLTGKIGKSGEAKADEAPKPNGRVVLRTAVETWTWSELTTQDAKDKYSYLASLVKTAMDEKKPYFEIEKDDILIRTDDFKELVEWDSSN